MPVGIQRQHGNVSEFQIYKETNRRFPCGPQAVTGFTIKTEQTARSRRYRASSEKADMQSENVLDKVIGANMKTQTKELYHCEECHLLFYLSCEQPVIIECPRCKHKYAMRWPEIPESMTVEYEPPELITGRCWVGSTNINIFQDAEAAVDIYFHYSLSSVFDTKRIKLCFFVVYLLHYAS